MDGEPTISGRYSDYGVVESDGETTPNQFPENITKADLSPRSIQPGETEIILQRHGSYIRDKEDPHAGSLTSEAQETEAQTATNFFETQLNMIPEAERNSVCFLFAASDTQYYEGGRRSLETAQIAQTAAKTVLAKHSLSPGNILNTQDGRFRGEGGPKTISKLREPQFFTKSPDYLKFLIDTYGGINLEFWIAYEQDRHRDVREKMGAEGPDDIADRTHGFVRAISRYAALWHEANPGKRLIVWAGTHYDTISPFVRNTLFGTGKDGKLMVDYGAGIVIGIDSEGRATTTISGTEYNVPLTKPETTKTGQEST